MDRANLPERKKILLVDDEVEITENLSPFLRINGYESLAARDGIEALEQLEAADPDLIVLDLDMPRMSGLEFLQELRKRGRHLPIIVLSKLNDADLRMHSHSGGAISFLEKPFRNAELVSQVGAIFRLLDTIDFESESEGEGEQLVVGRLKLCVEAKEVYWDDSLVKLQPLQYKLLEFLMRHPRRHFPNAALLDRFWGPGFVESVLPKAISGIRGKIPGIREVIEGRNGGYMFNAKVVRA